MALVIHGGRGAIDEATPESNPAFESIYKPGERCEHEGIYKCQGCNKEVTVAGDKKLPPQNHHQHEARHGEIRWKLFVYAQ